MQSIDLIWKSDRLDRVSKSLNLTFSFLVVHHGITGLLQVPVLLYGLVREGAPHGGGQLRPRVLGGARGHAGPVLHELPPARAGRPQGPPRPSRPRARVHPPGPEPQEPEDMTIDLHQHRARPRRPDHDPAEHPQEAAGEEAEGRAGLVRRALRAQLQQQVMRRTVRARARASLASTAKRGASFSARTASCRPTLSPWPWCSFSPPPTVCRSTPPGCCP